MGSDNPPNIEKNNNNLKHQHSYISNNIQQSIQSSYTHKSSINISENSQKPNDSEILQPISRHSNMKDMNNFQSQNHLSSKEVNANFHNSLRGFPSKNKLNSDPPSLMEKKQSRKLAQQYCSDVKKS